MISADFKIYMGVFYTFSPFQKYLPRKDWLQESIYFLKMKCVVVKRLYRTQRCRHSVIQIHNFIVSLFSLRL